MTRQSTANSKSTGLWRVELFRSGTVIVSRTAADPDHPHLYISCLLGDDDRLQVARDVRDLLNCVRVPAWWPDMERIAPTVLMAADGTKIMAVGPYIDAAPPTLNWRENTSPVAITARIKLIDLLCRKATGKKDAHKNP